MKVSRSPSPPPTFQPITLTILLETQEEVDALYRITELRIASPSSEALLGEIRAAIWNDRKRS